MRPTHGSNARGTHMPEPQAPAASSQADAAERLARAAKAERGDGGERGAIAHTAASWRRERQAERGTRRPSAHAAIVAARERTRLGAAAAARPLTLTPPCPPIRAARHSSPANIQGARGSSVPASPLSRPPRGAPLAGAPKAGRGPRAARRASAPSSAGKPPQAAQPPQAAHKERHRHQEKRGDAEVRGAAPGPGSPALRRPAARPFRWQRRCFRA
jgi:hypothetical protein